MDSSVPWANSSDSNIQFITPEDQTAVAVRSHTVARPPPPQARRHPGSSYGPYPYNFTPHQMHQMNDHFRDNFRRSSAGSQCILWSSPSAQESMSSYLTTLPQLPGEITHTHTHTHTEREREKARAPRASETRVRACTQK